MRSPLARRALCAALAGLFLLLPQPQPLMAEPMGEHRISGWREAVFSVSDMQAHVRFLKSVAGWQVIARSRLSREQLSHWGLPANASGRQVLMGNPGSESGYIRLVQFRGVAQRQVRSNTQSWDSGGIFDINVRVASMAEKFAQMQALGWQAGSDPLEFSFGPYRVVEWIARGPDGVTFALIERLEPPLEGWPNLKHFSRSFNSTLIVRDLAAAERFFRGVLGFSTYLEHRGASPAPGDNVLGLPLNIATLSERNIVILHPDGVNEGSVELLEYDGIEGRDASAHAVPPNLGILMLRFPVQNLPALEAHLRDAGVTPENRRQRIAVPPYGEVDILSVRAPDGAWLEFFEAQ